MICPAQSRIVVTDKLSPRLDACEAVMNKERAHEIAG
jgi:hypothetical protein